MLIAQSVIYALLLTLLSWESFRVLQSTGYRPQRGYCKLVLSFYFLSLAVLQTLTVVFREYWYWLIIPYLAVALTFILVKRKSRLRVTKRIGRMAAVLFVVLFALCYFVGYAYFTVALPISVLLSWLICLPIDSAINARYLRMAKAKIKQSGAEVIAITGSYGKTSVKDCLGVILENSLTAQGSCNTPLGIAAFVNGANLEGVKYLILEFGARKKGDIKELCKLYEPKYGIVTGVCAQHLSTFKTFDNIVQTKRELVEYLPADGFCVLNVKDEYTAKFTEYGKCRKCMSDRDIKVTVKQVTFDGSLIRIEHNGITDEVTVPQIGRHVCDTISICMQLCILLNQATSTTISHIVSSKQPKHRLELSYNGHFYILDDSYNANLKGIESCADTLRNFDCVKVAICQGIVECGKDTERQNEQCGKLLGSVCDVIIVTGKNSKYIMHGLAQCNCKSIFAKNLDEAVEKARQYVGHGILLFQNDLPDVVNL